MTKRYIDEFIMMNDSSARKQTMYGVCALWGTILLLIGWLGLLSAKTGIWDATNIPVIGKYLGEMPPADNVLEELYRYILFMGFFLPVGVMVWRLWVVHKLYRDVLVKLPSLCGDHSSWSASQKLQESLVRISGMDPSDEYDLSYTGGIKLSGRIGETVCEVGRYCYRQNNFRRVPIKRLTNGVLMWLKLSTQMESGVITVMYRGKNSSGDLTEFPGLTPAFLKTFSVYVEGETDPQCVLTPAVQQLLLDSVHEIVKAFAEKKMTFVFRPERVFLIIHDTRKAYLTPPIFGVTLPRKVRRDAMFLNVMLGIAKSLVAVIQSTEKACQLVEQVTKQQETPEARAAAEDIREEHSSVAIEPKKYTLARTKAQLHQAIRLRLGYETRGYTDTSKAKVSLALVFGIVAGFVILYAFFLIYHFFILRVYPSYIDNVFSWGLCISSAGLLLAFLLMRSSSQRNVMAGIVTMIFLLIGSHWLLTSFSPECLRVNSVGSIGLFEIENNPDSVMAVVSYPKMRHGGPRSFIGRIPKQSELYECLMNGGNVDRAFQTLEGYGRVDFQSPYTKASPYSVYHDVYIGHWQAGRPKGYGLMMKIDGAQVEGDWKEWNQFDKTPVCDGVYRTKSYQLYGCYDARIRDGNFYIFMKVDNGGERVVFWDGKHFVKNSHKEYERIMRQQMKQINRFINSNRPGFNAFQKEYKELYERYKDYL